LAAVSTAPNPPAVAPCRISSNVPASGAGSRSPLVIVRPASSIDVLTPRNTTASPPLTGCSIAAMPKPSSCTPVRASTRTSAAHAEAASRTIDANTLGITLPPHAG
jgi:hypothetical protein